MDQDETIAEADAFSHSTEKKMYQAELAHYKRLVAEWKSMANRLERALHDAMKLIEDLKELQEKPQESKL